MMLIILIASFLLASVRGRCLEGWTNSSDRCYKSFGSYEFNGVKEICDNERASVISVLDEAENNFLKNNAGGGSKWLGIEESDSHPLDAKHQIFWMDANIGSYSNFAFKNKCTYSSKCCVSQFSNGSWGFMDCDYQYEVWCYLTLNESHNRLFNTLDEKMRNVTEIVEKYRVEQLRSDNIKRLAAILDEVRDIIPMISNQGSSGSTLASTIALIVSLIALTLGTIVFLKLKKRKRTKIPDYDGIKRSSFRYSQRATFPSKIDEQSYFNDYCGREKNIGGGNSFDGNRLSSIDQHCARTSDPELVTSDPHEM